MRLLQIQHLFGTAAAGTVLLVSLSTANAGRMFPDEPSRPHIMAGSQPNWGYNQTCWQRFPPLPPCYGDGNCFGDASQSAFDYQQQAGSYSSHSQPAPPSQSFSTLPGSIMPQSMDGVPYSPPVPNSFQGGYSTPAMGPSMALPPVPEQYSTPGHGPGETFQSPQSAAGSLPPLPAPISPIPPIPDQSRVAPQRLTIGADGKVMVTQSAMRTSNSTSSRYGQKSQMQRSEPLSATALPEMRISSMQLANSKMAGPESHAGQRYGLLPVNPVHSTKTTSALVPSSQQSQYPVPVRSISQSRTISPGQGARYGANRPPISGPQNQGAGLEPLRTTPGVSRQQ